MEPIQPQAQPQPKPQPQQSGLKPKSSQQPPGLDQQEEFSYLVMPQQNKYQDFKNPNMPKEPSQKPLPVKGGKTGYIIGGIVVLIVLGALAYYLLGLKQEESAEQKLPKTWLTKYFNKETCDQPEVCGDDADPDKDGLTNYDEFKKTRTSLTDADSDDDGLADGDEANVYQTDPTDKFTDPRTLVSENNYTDGHQIKNEYDPLTPGLKFSATRKQQISDDIAKHGLHEPTISTLK